MKMVMDSSSSTTSNSTSNQLSTNSASNNAAGSNCQSSPEFNPQLLGREFVRQYYTVLNTGPHFMHRFYSDDSCLVHGGCNRQGESTVYGQSDINNKIMSFNFKDCHTKIRQVDSMETVGKGVVVQVIGELSNNGEPMRRFFQTFVLAPQSPSKYYVRNDIFRYQDEVFVDDDECNEVEKSEDFDETENEQKGSAMHDKIESDVTSLTVKDNVFENVNVNGSVSHNEISDVEKTGESDGEVASKSEHSPFTVNNEWESTNTRRDDGTNEVASISDGNSATPPPSNQNEPLSYASMVNKNFYNPPFSNASTTFVSKTTDVLLNTAPFPKTTVVENSTTPVMVPPVSQPTGVGSGGTGGSGGKPPVSSHPREQKTGRVRSHQGVKPRNDSREVTPAYGDNDSSAGETNEFGSGSRRQQFADEQQVFVGNLMQDITEEQLRIFFGKFGNIVDVRINRANQKSGRTPNYGFVTFDDPAVVKDILNQKPIYFNDHRFNVEEKRSQSTRGSGERMGREVSRSGSGGGGSHGSSAGRAVNSNSGNRLTSGSGSGPRRDRGERGSQTFVGNDSGRRNGGGGGGGPRGSSYNRR